MKKTLITAFMIFVFINCHSQGFINSDKFGSKSYLLKFSGKEKIQTVTNETDSTLTFLIRDSAKQHLDLLLHFDAFGKCDREVRILSCDSCYEKILNRVLAEKDYKWTKVDDKTYVSKHSKRLTLSILPDRPFSFVIQRNNMSRNEYKRQFKKSIKT